MTEAQIQEQMAAYDEYCELMQQEENEAWEAWLEVQAELAEIMEGC